MSKKSLLIVVALLLISLSVYFFLSQEGGSSNPQEPQAGGTVNVERAPLIRDPNIKKDDMRISVMNDFTRQYNNQDAVLGKTVIVHPYALQEWSDKNVSGTTLLKVSSSGDWVILGGEGGVINEEVLIYFGVPVSYAAQLIKKLEE